MARPLWHLGVCGAALVWCCLADARPAARSDFESPPVLVEELLRSAQRWSNRNRPDLARHYIAKVLAIEPTSPLGLAYLGELALRENKIDEARVVLHTLQTQHAGEPATRDMQALFRVYTQDREKLARMRLTARAGRTAEAAQLAVELFPRGLPAFGSLSKEFRTILSPPAAAARRGSVRLAQPGATTRAPLPVRYSELDLRFSGALADPGVAAQARAAQARSEADQALAAGQLSPALRLYEAALAQTPDDAWLRHSLARLYLRLSLPGDARNVMDQGVVRNADDADMHYARALVLSTLDDNAAALADMQTIPADQRSPGMQALTQRLRVAELLAAPTSDRLQAAETLAADDEDLLYSVANAWFQIRQPAAGLALMQRRMQRSPATSPAFALNRAALLDRAGDDTTLAAALPPLLQRTDWTDAQQSRLLGIYADHDERLILQLRQQGDTAQAQALARAALPPTVSPDAATASAGRRLQADKVQAQLLLAAGDSQAAVSQLEAALLLDPVDADVRLDLGNAYYQLGQMADAQTQASWLQQHLAATDLPRQLALLRLWQRSGATVQAQALSDTLRAAYPEDTEVLLHSARLERSSGAYASAVALFRQARDNTQAAGDAQAQARIQNDIDGIEARRQAWIEVGQESLEKNSTDGRSSLRGWERPAVAWLPWGYDGRMFVHIDQVQLDAGGLPPTAADATDFGQVAGFVAPNYQPVAQTASGFNAGVGYQGERWRWDIGQVGIGFPVSNLVGGVRQSGDFGSLGYQWEISRRPQTGTLLSYAGAHDPVSGAVWGGVVATGVGGGLTTELAGLQWSARSSYASLAGQNVLDNQRLQWRLSADRDVYTDAAQVLNVGLALSGLHHDKDLSGLTWGQGGYYSPVRSFSLSLPVDWSGRQGAWTWALRAAVSASQSSSSATDYFPTSAALQGVNQRSNSGGDSAGGGWAVSAAGEYQASTRLALGGRFAREVSDYYTPLNVMLYARYWLDPVPATLAQRPRPPGLYSQF